MKILHVGDLHTTENPTDHEREVAASVVRRAAAADLVVVAGDLTNQGLHTEYAALKELLTPIRDRVLLVRGNHDMHRFMDHLGQWLPDTDTGFEPRAYPVHEWHASWWEPIVGTHQAMGFLHSLPDPYNRLCQPPVWKLVDGTGPYYSVVRDGWRIVVLDACQWVLGAAQYAWLDSQLADPSLPTLVFLHHSVLPTGSIYDGAVLWDRRQLLHAALTRPHVKGVFSAHVHYNRCWTARDTIFATTADRGGMRLIDLADDRIASVEALGNDRHRGSGARAETPVDQDQLPFICRHAWANEAISPRSFNMSTVPEGIWSKGCFGWHDEEGPGGLVWHLPNTGDAAAERWFGVNFHSSTAWRVTVTIDGREYSARAGAGGSTEVVTAAIPWQDFDEITVRLEQEAPALGHACPYLVLDDRPVAAFNPY